MVGRSSARILATVLVAFFALTASATATTRGVQVLEGVIEPGASVVGYPLKGVRRGDRIEGHLHGTSGNLNPVLALVALPFDAASFQRHLNEETGRVTSESGDPHELMVRLAEKYFLAWNSDDFTNYDATMAAEIPHDGDFMVLAVGAPVPKSGGEGAEPGFGRFQLVLGLNPVTEINQSTAATGEAFALDHTDLIPPEHRVQQLPGELKSTRPRAILNLNPFEAEDELTVRIEALEGKQAPTLQLLDFGQKMLAVSTATTEPRIAVLRYHFRAPARDYRVRVAAGPESFGKYRLTLGTNAPEVANQTDSTDNGPAVARLPIPVNISIQLDQISSLSQREGNFGVVATLKMQWQDPTYAFSPGSCQCNFKSFDEIGFRHFLEDHHARWPDFIIFNLQGKRSNQGVLISVESNGTARYMERFSASLQAPDMDFRLFPFDSQNLYIHINSIYPSERYKFIQDPIKNAIGKQVGVDEWVIAKFSTGVSITDDLKSRFSFHIQVKRHLKYYILKIFMPLMIILVTSWATFMLKDYDKRIDVTGSHLLLFIAFNFTISSDLPRLGYVTFMDTILASAFVAGSLLIVLNVYFKRAEAAGRLAEIRYADKILLALYPIAYFVPWVTAAFTYGVF
ncbi:MAG: hypothetical protein WCF85_02120 [Rhodospirillaceae bacterium]